ncbi:hypothetical protein PANA5342_pPANA10013 (plasmid) [Pantoea ananatis LMG 5342]|nr:hypothetical protein PANA5342_pPANA10013 [Pantoea ananatis LMG 5342]
MPARNPFFLTQNALRVTCNLAALQVNKLTLT